MIKNGHKIKERLKKTFLYASSVAIGINIAGPLMLEDQSRDIQDQTQLTTQDIRSLTDARVRLARADNKTLKLFLYSTYSPQMIDKIVMFSAKPHDAQGTAHKHPLFGNNGPIDKLTLGLSGQIFSCTIILPSKSITLKDLQETILFLPQSSIRNFPGTASDYMKIITAHELTHCNQSIVFDDHSLMEAEADKGALDHFIKTGGNPDIVRSVLYMRTINAMGDALYTEGEVLNYVANPGLVGRYFNEYAAITPQISKDGYSKAGKILQKYASSKSISESSLYNASILYGVVNNALYDADFKPEPEVLAVLRLYRDAYEFFTTDPANKAKTPAPGIQHIS